MQATLITVGDEILIGQIVDTNSAWIAQQLNLQGINVAEIISTSDTKEAITKSIKQAMTQSEVVIMTGGLGPTKDDITKKTIADYFGVGMHFDQVTYDRIVRLFERFGRTATEAHKEQCYMPDNVSLLLNKKGTAPGMWFEEEGSVLVSLPGVPYEMKYLMEFEVLPKLKERFPLAPIVHRTILTVGEGESIIADAVRPVEDSLPPNMKLAFLPNIGQVRLRLSATGENEETIRKSLEEKSKEIEQLIPELIFGYDTQTLEAAVGELLKAKGKTLATAESCTGGYLAHMLTSISGSSAYFIGSIVAYSNQVKEQQLGVKAETLEKYGAVSEETVKEMVTGALRLLQTDIAVSVSGIAGPTGGTPDKPVGTIWLAIGDKTKIQTQKLQLGKDRLKNIHYTSVQALNMVRKFLLAR